MINENKVKTMTKLAIYKKHQSKEELKIEKYYKNDYVFLNNWKVRIYWTLTYLLFVGWNIFDQVYNNDYNILELDIKKFVIKIVLYYFILMGVVSFIASLVYKRRYDKGKRNLDAYYKDLGKLS